MPNQKVGLPTPTTPRVGEDSGPYYVIHRVYAVILIMIHCI